MDKADLSKAISQGESDIEQNATDAPTGLTSATTRHTAIHRAHRCARLNSLHSLTLTAVPRFIKGLVVPLDPPPPKASIDDADYIPEMTAGWFSIITFGWMNSLMTLGYARPLEAPDLWKLQEHRSSEVIADVILQSFEARRKKAEEYNVRLANGEIKPPLKLRVLSLLRGDREERLKHWREKHGKKHASLAWAMNDSIKRWFWIGGLLKVIGDTAQVTSPLLVKV